MQDKMVLGEKYKYKHVYPFKSHGKMLGWGAHRKNGRRIIRIGNFDDQDVAGLVVAATFLDASLLNQSYKPIEWLMQCRNDEEYLKQWILGVAHV